MHWVWVVGALVSAPAELSVDASAELLVRNLALPTVAEYAGSDPIAVSGSDTPAVERVIGLLVRRGRLVFRVPMSADVTSVARDRGARWLVELDTAAGILQGRLRQVDGGLWSAPDPGIFAAAQARPTDAVPNGGGPNAPLFPQKASGPRSTAGLYGPVRKLAELPGEPLALATCPGMPTPLLVLTRSHVFRVSLDDGWSVQAQLPLDGFEKTSTPSRFPLGVIQCPEATKAAFTTSDLATGHEIDPISLSPRSPLAGAPLAYRETSPKNPWVLGVLHEGRAAWRSTDGGLVWSHPSGRRDMVLGVDGVLRLAGSVLTESGLGATAVRIDGLLYWVRTGLGTWGDADRVQLGSGDAAAGAPVELPASVRATALGRFFKDEWRLVVAVPEKGRTSLSTLRVVLP